MNKRSYYRWIKYKWGRYKFTTKKSDFVRKKKGRFFERKNDFRSKNLRLLEDNKENLGPLLNYELSPTKYLNSNFRLIKTRKLMSYKRFDLVVRLKMFLMKKRKFFRSLIKPSDYTIVPHTFANFEKFMIDTHLSYADIDSVSARDLETLAHKDWKDFNKEKQWFLSNDFLSIDDSKLSPKQRKLKKYLLWHNQQYEQNHSRTWVSYYRANTPSSVFDASFDKNMHFTRNPSVAQEVAVSRRIQRNRVATMLSDLAFQKHHNMYTPGYQTAIHTNINQIRAVNWISGVDNFALNIRNNLYSGKKGSLLFSVFMKPGLSLDKTYDVFNFVLNSEKNFYIDGLKKGTLLQGIDLFMLIKDYIFLQVMIL